MSNIVLTISSLFISCVAYIISVRIINIPLGIPLGLTGLIFYHLGTMIKTGLDKRFVIFTIIVWAITCPFIKLDMAAFIYRLYPVNILQGLGGTMAVFYFSKIISRFRITRLLEVSGKNSLYIFIIHAILLYVLTYAYRGTMQSTIKTITCLIIILIMFVYNQKKETKAL